MDQTKEATMGTKEEPEEQTRAAELLASMRRDWTDAEVARVLARALEIVRADAEAVLAAMGGAAARCEETP